MAEASGSACTQCSSPFCLGLHEWIDNSCDEIFGGVDVDALLSDIKDCHVESASQPAGIDECLPPSAKRVRRFHDATEEELEVASKGIVPKNTKGNNRWALNNFEAWRASHNASHADSPCPDNILLTCTAEELDTWLSRFVMETRKEDGTRFPARSIKLLLSGLQRYMRASSPTPLTRVTTNSDGSEARVILFSRSYWLMEWELLSTIMSHFHLMKRTLCGMLEFLVLTLLKLSSELCSTTLAKPFA